ncbi:unnamed protein product [Closterium sp. Naga37s-1]|nr:unnamed protein product [Closterium sp. Naga37s-1]
MYLTHAPSLTQPHLSAPISLHVIEVIAVIDSQVIPIIRRSALSGFAIFNTELPVFFDRPGFAIFNTELAVFFDRPGTLPLLQPLSGHLVMRRLTNGRSGFAIFNTELPVFFDRPGFAIFNTELPVFFDRPGAPQMLADILAERGYFVYWQVRLWDGWGADVGRCGQVWVDTRIREVPVRIDPSTLAIECLRRTTMDSLLTPQSATFQPPPETKASAMCPSFPGGNPPCFVPDKELKGGSSEGDASGMPASASLGSHWGEEEVT